MNRPAKLVTYSRRMRHEPTPAELLLWRLLRGRRLAGLKFRRQHPIGPYIADFYCAAALLVVELDGESHVGREPRDRARDAHFAGLGLLVLRFWNPQLYDEQEAVVEEVYRVATERIAALGEHPRHDGAKHWRR